MTAMPRESTRISSLDGLRAVAISCVIVSHIANYAMNQGYNRTVLEYASSLGGLGVQIFFVLSGFLITTLLLDEWKQSGRIDLRHFYFRAPRSAYEGGVHEQAVIVPCPVAVKYARAGHEQ